MIEGTPNKQETLKVQCGTGCGRLLDANDKSTLRFEYDDTRICAACWATRPSLRDQLEGAW
jgi:hypothetical protein